MTTGLTDASYLLLLVSKASAQSRWVTREWMSALASRAIIVIPVRLDDQDVPVLLRDIVYFDARTDFAGEVQRVVAFFKAETAPVTRRRGDNQALLAKATRRQLRLVALRCIDEAAVESFCFDAEINRGTLKGSSLEEQVMSLLQIVASEGRLEFLAKWLELEKRKCVSHQLTLLEPSSMWNWAYGAGTE